VFGPPKNSMYLPPFVFDVFCCLYAAFPISSRHILSVIRGRGLFRLIFWWLTFEWAVPFRKVNKPYHTWSLLSGFSIVEVLQSTFPIHTSIAKGSSSFLNGTIIKDLPSFPRITARIPLPSHHSSRLYHHRITFFLATFFGIGYIGEQASETGTQGTRLFFMVSLAVALSPILSIMISCSPNKFLYRAQHKFWKIWSFSDRKPFLGELHRHFVIFCAAMIYFGIFKYDCTTWRGPIQPLRPKTDVQAFSFRLRINRYRFNTHF